MASFVGIWAILVSIVGLNGFAAGVVGILHAWRSGRRRGGRVLTAAASAGLLPTSLLALAYLLEAVPAGATSPIAVLIVLGTLFVTVASVSAPGALIVARKLDKLGDEYRAFE